MKPKEKTLKQPELSEKNNKRNLNPEKNNKIKSNNTRNELPDIINLIGKSTSELPYNYDCNTYKNEKLKERFMKILFQKGKKRRIKDKNGKILILNKNNSNKENNPLTNNLNNKKIIKDLLQSYNLTKNNISPSRNNCKESKSKICSMYKTMEFPENCITEKLKSLDIKNKNKIDNNLSQKEDSFFNINGNRNRGTISFNNFIINKSNDFENKNNNEFIFYNKRKNSYGSQRYLYLDNDENFNLRESKNLKVKNNFRNSQRNKSFNGNLLLTSFDKYKTNVSCSLKLLEIPKNNKNIKIIIKSNESQNKKDKEKIDEIPKKEKNEKNIENNNNQDILTENQNKKNENKNKSVFSEIMDEVKEEKNYVQKIVHMKLIQGIKLF